MHYHAKYFAYELTKRSASNSLEKLSSTLSNAQVDLNPHQIEAALFAFKSPLSTGQEAMEKLRITSKTTLQKLRDTGVIRFSQPEKKIILYDSHSIDQYLAKHIKEAF
jgi:hypothetical protein